MTTRELANIFTAWDKAGLFLKLVSETYKNKISVSVLIDQEANSMTVRLPDWQMINRLLALCSFEGTEDRRWIWIRSKTKGEEDLNIVAQVNDE